MKALLLAAGYATRLRPLTDRIAKPLLPVGGRPMADWILDRIAESGVIDGVEVGHERPLRAGLRRVGREPRRHGLRRRHGSNDDRLGALGDIRFALERSDLGGERLLVIAADNLFEFSLADYIAFWRAKADGSAIAVHRLADPGLAHLYGVVELADDGRVVGLEEKPEHPRSDLVSTATYLFSADHLALPRVATSTRGTRPTRRAASSAGSPSASRSTASASARPGSTSATPDQLQAADSGYRGRRRAAAPRRVLAGALSARRRRAVAGVAVR